MMFKAEDRSCRSDEKGENVQVIYGLHINQVRQAVDRELGLDQ